MASPLLIIASMFVFTTACNNPQTKTDNVQKLVAAESSKIDTKAAGILHDAFNDLLKKYVSESGAVNYQQLKTEINKLDNYLNSLAAGIPDKSWSKNASLAYWINAYNAFTIKLILKNYPVKSIKELDKGKPWDVAWITLGGKKYSLNNIENDIIRPQFKDARIHFALNCAAKSCPPLANSAFTENNINLLMESQASKFTNSSANQLGSAPIKISKIFDWYKEDFGNVIDFLNKYSTTKVKQGTKIEYMDYNWSLNEK